MMLIELLVTFFLDTCITATALSPGLVITTSAGVATWCLPGRYDIDRTVTILLPDEDIAIGTIPAGDNMLDVAMPVGAFYRVEVWNGEFGSESSQTLYSPISGKCLKGKDFLKFRGVFHGGFLSDPAKDFIEFRNAYSMCAY